MQSYWAKKRVTYEKGSAPSSYSNRNGLGHQHDRHFIVLTAAGLAQSVERVPGFDSQGLTNTQGLKITEK